MSTETYSLGEAGSTVEITFGSARLHVEAGRDDDGTTYLIVLVPGGQRSRRSSGDTNRLYVEKQRVSWRAP